MSLHFARRLFAVLIALLGLAPVACGSPPDVRTPRAEILLAPAAKEVSWEKAESVFESRCVVCHGCYDAPCS